MASRESHPKEVASCRAMLRYWSGIAPQALASRPCNAQEVFSVFAVANGCSFEETLERAASALLAEWKASNHDSKD